MENLISLTLILIDGSPFVLTSSNINFLNDFLEIFCIEFSENGDAVVCSNGIENQTNIDAFIQKYRNVNSIERIYQLKNNLKNLPENSLFYIVLGKLDSENWVGYFSKLLSLNKIEKNDIPNFVENEEFLKFIKIYNVAAFGNRRVVIGSKGYCRFCKTHEGNYNSFGSLVTFKNESHAISEALGNKKLITRDECDACNDRFSRGIEPSLINYLKISRSLFGIKGKKGRSKLKGNEFEIDKESINIKYDGTISELVSLDEVSQTLNLADNDYFVPLHIYKCLVKFAIGVLPEQELQFFEETVSWINGLKTTIDLPRIISFDTGKIYSEPLLFIFTKKLNSYIELPYTYAEFRFANKGLVFIIPFCSKDTGKLTTEPDSEFDKVWNLTLGAHPNIDDRNILRYDFTSEERKKIAINLVVKNLKFGENAFVEEPNDFQ
ncbi:hypothetical protein QM480_01625 [Flectobacillus sp. DC10W]|uniref:HNH endonuclease 5 domain-containing protein n=1 Tax=Flectobacillus longus TaxID=2984207 RepID=A0ABT6YIR0_9BACT|nr:hypothetical protein [Flectobacillus longus]MDI9863008.1 hypothetical protein [Flectobacillus longus]